MLLVYTPKSSNRADYAFKLVLGHLSGVDFRITTSEEEFNKYTGPKFSYGRDFGPASLYIASTTLLFEKAIAKQPVNVISWNGLPVFFSDPVPHALLPFDIFAASFFLATRYEEYLSIEVDEHGRFKCTDSIAFKHGFLEKPLLNLWSNALKKALQKHYPALAFKPRNFLYLSTFDIDVAYAYKGRSIGRIIKATAKNIIRGEFPHLLTRWPVLAGICKDPYDTYALQEALQQQYKLKQHYFTLCGKYGPFDKNLSIENAPLQRNLVKQLAWNNPVGLHPSYASDHIADKIKQEKQALEHAIGNPVTSSRQHFLRLKFPDTYRSLIQCGITEDYSMGYPDHVGFRASTCTPYPFYDLPTDQETVLMIYPPTVMDNTLKDYMNLSANEAITRIKQLIDSIFDVNGMFISIWHNHSLANSGAWKGWLTVYEEMVKYASEKTR